MRLTYLYICTLGFYSFGLTSFRLLAEKRLKSSEAGFKILGSIVSDKNQSNKNSVVLIKYKEKNAIKAIKVGDTIHVQDKALILEKVKQEYLIASDQDQKIKIFKDEFFQTETLLSLPVQTAAPAKAIPYSDSYKEDGFEREKDKIEMSEGFRKKTMENLGQILMEASASPVVGTNGIEGFEMDQIEAGSIYQKAGLINGDIVTSINGIALTNVAATIKLLQSLKDAASVNFEFKREGQVLSMSVNVR